MQQMASLQEEVQQLAAAQVNTGRLLQMKEEALEKERQIREDLKKKYSVSLETKFIDYWLIHWLLIYVFILKFLWSSLVASFSSVLFSASFFFFLLLSVFLLLHDEDTRCRKRLFVFFSSFVIHWWVHFPSSFPHMSTSPAVTHFFFENSWTALAPKKQQQQKRNYSYVLSFSILIFQILSVECLVAIGWYDVCGWHWAVWCVRLTVMEINEPVWLSRPKKYRVLPKNMYGPATEGDLEKVFYMLGKFPACCVLRYEICMEWYRCFLPLLLDLTVKKQQQQNSWMIKEESFSM